MSRALHDSKEGFMFVSLNRRHFLHGLAATTVSPTVSEAHSEPSNHVANNNDRRYEALHLGLIPAYQIGLTPEENSSCNADLARDIRFAGFGFFHVRGRYREFGSS